MEDYQVDIKEINENLRIRIMASENLNNPEQNECFNDCRFILTRNHEFYPEKALCTEDYPLTGDEEKDIKIIEEETGKIAFPLYAYIHSGVRLAMRSFSCSWDSGCIGFVIADNEDDAKEFIKAWNHYLNEPEYGFIVEEREDLFNKDGVKVTERWVIKEAISGFYSPSEAMEEAMNYV